MLALFAGISGFLYVSLMGRVTLIEAQQVLGTFDAPLREYAANKLNKQGVHLMKVSSWCTTDATQQLLI